jgi:hypothetical protein
MTTPNKPSETTTLNNQQPLFRTPNPDELKQAAQVDPIQESPGVEEASVADVPVQDELVDQPNPDMDDVNKPTLGDRQIIHANLSGH